MQVFANVCNAMIKYKCMNGEWIKLRTNLDKFEWKSFVKDAVNLGATGQFLGADLTAGSLDSLVQVLTEGCYHPTGQRRLNLQQSL